MKNDNTIIVYKNIYGHNKHERYSPINKLAKIITDSFDKYSMNLDELKRVKNELDYTIIVYEYNEQLDDIVKSEYFI